MTKIILVSATVFEIEPTLRFLEPGRQGPNSYQLHNSSIDVCITGVGMVNTAFAMGRLEGRSYNMAVNAGIAGSFGKYAPGEVLNVTQDCFCELGAEDGDSFLSIDALGFGQQQVSMKHPLRHALSSSLPLATGVTVNTVHGNEQSIEALRKICAADVESMEGAAFIHAVNAFGWPALQLRAISNKVERRNRDNWQIPLAIGRLNEVLTTFIQEVSRE